MSAPLDISIGDVAGNLTIIKTEVGRSSGGHILSLAQCVCGNTIKIRNSSFKGRRRKVCDCFKTTQLEQGSLLAATHKAWRALIDRCTNTKNKRYFRYGGRGIKVCDRWLMSFKLFLEDMGEKPSKEYSIDRIDNDGNYTPDNCKWSTRHQQDRNKYTNIWFTYYGHKKCLTDWSILLGITRETLRKRIILLNWDVTTAFETPSRTGRYVPPYNLLRELQNNLVSH